jgi:hypothetical protein
VAERFRFLPTLFSLFPPELATGEIAWRVSLAACVSPDDGIRGTLEKTTKPLIGFASFIGGVFVTVENARVAEFDMRREKVAMAQQISRSVGKGGANLAPDVFVVQFHLSNWRASPALQKLVVPTISGKCDAVTITAIGAFQRTILGIAKPDCRVDPNGATFKRLVGPVTFHSSKPLRTDHTAISELRKRAHDAIARGDKYVRSMGLVTTPFRAEFDDFAAGVAHELRHRIVYRSDGGRIARGLVRASGDLELIHKALKEGKLEDGEPVALEADLWRRKDPVAANRWVMSIRFRPTVSTFDEDNGAKMVTDPNDLQKRLCTATDKLIRQAALVAADIPGEQGKRIRKMVEIADRLDCQRATQLWYYNRAVAFEYFTWRTSDARRKEMTSATAGKMPFDGQILNSGAWRLFPFKSLAQKYGAHSGMRDSELETILLDIDSAIFMTFADIDAELSRNNLALSQLNQLPNGGSSMYGLAEPFLKHLIQLQKSPDHLYSAYK